MSHVISPPTPTTLRPKRSRRLIRLELQDARGGPAVGARVDVIIDGMAAGSLVIGDTGQATVEVEGPHLPVEFSARFVGMNLRGIASHAEKTHVIRFPIVAPATFTARPRQASCPDGTTGVPCVICDIVGVKVRLCV